MRWLQMLADWMLLGSYRRRAYQRTYRRYQTEAAHEVATMCKQAELEANNVVADAVKAAAARLKAAEATAATLSLQAQATGLAKGRKTGLAAIAKAREEAAIAGHSEGLLAGYVQAANNFGLVLPQTVSDVPQLRTLTLDVNSRHTNIYNTGKSWVVRVIVNDQRLVQVVPYSKGAASRAMALVEAAHYRDIMTGSPGSYIEPFFLQCQDEALRLLGTDASTIQLAICTCEIFHTRLLQTPILGRMTWAGQDPADRFQLDDPTILYKSWCALFSARTKLTRVVEAFATIGLASNSTTRDLLMFTGQELVDTPGFGIVSLNKLRTGLARIGLALWDDPLPSQHTEPGAHTFRAIDID